MSALRELSYGRFRMPRKKEFTFEDTADLTNEDWVQSYERAGVAIRENWTQWKDKYRRMERNFAKNLYNAIIAVNKNIDWYNKGANPPVDRKTFYKLMLCWMFEPFRNHLNKRQKENSMKTFEFD